MPILATRRARLSIAGLSVALLAAACSGSDGAPPPDGTPGSSATAPAATETVEVATTATVAPTRDAAAVAPSPSDTRAAAEAALIGIMRGGAEDPFAVAPDALPPALLALLDELGVDLLLGAALSVQDGVLTIASVFPGSPAERAGLAGGDAVLGAGCTAGAPLGCTAELRAVVQSAAPGSQYALDIRRADRVLTVSVEREPDGAAEWRSALLTSLALGLLMGDGATVGSNSLLGETLEETPDGLLVIAVFPSSPADIAGLRAGDILTSVDGNPLASIEDRDALLQSPAPFGSDIAIMVLRDGVELALVAPLTPRR